MADPRTRSSSESDNRTLQTPARPALSPVLHFQAGGVLRRDALYVVRGADTELLEALVRGEDCYLLGPPQSGKSSMRLHIADRLAEGGVRCVTADLGKIGGKPTADAFFFGLIDELSSGLQLPDPTREWLLHGQLSPAHRFSSFLDDLLRRVIAPVVVFIEEIDLLRDHPIGADLFSVLHGALDGRAEDPALSRLTFCLVGTAPPDLLHAGRYREVRLMDFTAAEAEALLPGLRDVTDDAQRLLRAVLQRTHGHPGMTHRVCAALAAQVPQPDGPEKAAAERVAQAMAEVGADRPDPGETRRPTGPASWAEAIVLRWLRADRHDDYLPRGRALLDAEDGLGSGNRPAGMPVAVAEEFLQAGQHLRRRERAAHERRRLQQGALFCLSLVTGVLFLSLSWVQKAQRGEREALSQAEQALVRERENAAALQKKLQAQAEGHQASLLAMWPDRRTAALVSAIKTVQEDVAQGREPPRDQVRALSTSLASVLHQRRDAQAEGEDREASGAPGNPGSGVLSGHTGPVVALAYAPDGTHLCTASFDGTARLWDTRTGQAVMTLTGHAGKVYTVSFSPDGARVVTAGHDGTVRLWDGRTGQALLTLTGHVGEIYTATFSSFGTRIVTAGEDRTARLWDGRTGQAIALLRGHTGKVLSATFSPDGTRVVTTSTDRTARLWDGRTGQAVATLSGHTGMVYAAAFSPDGQRVATASFDHSARLWDGRDGHPIGQLVGHEQPVVWVAFSGDGRRVATTSHDGTVRLWDGQNGRLLRNLTEDAEPSQAMAAALSPKGTLLAAAGADHIVRLWDLETGQPAGVLQHHPSAIYGMAFSPDGSSLCTAGEDHTARIYPATIRGLYALSCQVLNGRPEYRQVQAECAAFRKGG